MQQAYCKYDVPPADVVDLVNNLLSHCSSKCFVDTCLDSLRRLVCDLNRLLKQTKREVGMLLAGDPQSELRMRLDCGLLSSPGNYHLVYFLHEFETQMAVLQGHPSSSLQACHYCSFGYHFLPLSHTDFLYREFLLFSSKFVNGRGGISTSWQ